MSWKKDVFRNFKLYAVTDLDQESDEVLLKVEKAYRGGVDIVQLRSKRLGDAALIRLGRKIRKLADENQKLFFVNDRPDLALALNADGVHLGQEDMPVEVARKLFRRAGVEMFVGKSTHAMDQAKAACLEKADYIGIGPVFETPTKPDYKPAGLEYVREVSAFAKIPCVAIGGIHLNNIDQVLEAGGRRAAVVRAIFASEQPDQAARKLRERIEKYN